MTTASPLGRLAGAPLRPQRQGIPTGSIGSATTSRRRGLTRSSTTAAGVHDRGAAAGARDIRRRISMLCLPSRLPVWYKRGDAVR
ncbi:MAG: hypothetical protein ACRDRI_27140 [Pseudonocardiaceae bacterium]